MSGRRSFNQQPLISWFNRWEKKIVSLLTLLLPILFLMQVILLNQDVKAFVSRTTKLEGKAIEESQLLINRGEIELSIENEDSLKGYHFYLNGEELPETGKKSIKLTVKANDIIEVGGIKTNKISRITVTSISNNISAPELGKSIIVHNNLVLIDRVKMK